MKGEFNDVCNRKVCDKKEAVYYNHYTKQYYCKDCAKLINDANRIDAHDMYGHELCTLTNTLRESK